MRCRAMKSGIGFGRAELRGRESELAAIDEFFCGAPGRTLAVTQESPMARHRRPGDNPRAGLLDLQVDLKQDQRPQDDRQKRRSDVGEAVQVREVIMLLGNHGSDDQVNQRNDSPHSHSYSHKTTS